MLLFMIRFFLFTNSFLVLLILVGCDSESLDDEYYFGTSSNVVDVVFREKILINSVDSEVTYMVGANFSETIAREKMNQARTIEGVHSISSNQHIYTLNQDQMTTTVYYVDGFHLATDGRVEVEENPLEGKRLSREFEEGIWGEFVLVFSNDVSPEITAAVEKMNTDISLDKGISPEGVISVGESWSGTNFVINSRGVTSELIYTDMFRKAALHRGILCAEISIHNVLHTENGKLTMDVKGTSYYSFKYGMEIDSEMYGTMVYYSDHAVGGRTIRRTVHGNVCIINRITFE